jgi:hypothetical protein
MMLGASMAWTLGVELLWVALVPLVVAAVAMIVARRLDLRPRAAWAVSVGVGYIVGQVGLVSRAGGLAAAMNALAVPHEARDWLPWAVALAAGATVWVVHATAATRWVGHLLAIVVSLAAPARLLGGSVYLMSRWSAGEKIVYLMLLAGAIGVVWWLLESCKDSEQPLVRGMLLIYTAVGTAVAVTLSGSFVYGELCGVVAAALTGTVLSAAALGATGFASGWSRSALTDPVAHERAVPENGLGGAAGVVTMSLGSLILLGYFYAELANADALLLAVALVAAGGWLPMPAWSGPGWRATVRAVLCVVPMALAVAGAYAATLAETASPY